MPVVTKKGQKNIQKFILKKPTQFKIAFVNIRCRNDTKFVKNRSSFDLPTYIHNLDTFVQYRVELHI